MANQADETTPHDAGRRTNSVDRPNTRIASSPAVKPSRNADWREPPVYDSGALFGEANEVGIVHEGALYRLKITRQGKLILNK
ncbi:MAG: hemin uptake protein HemP [Nitratireductor sp.]|nr:hemin uptake protein HemP [Nitratireductor sp.]